MREAEMPFVGRDHVVGKLVDLAEEASTGYGRIAVLSGAPGMGKTRLLDEAALAAASRGMLSVWGRCLRDEGVPPYFLWQQVLGALTTSVGVPTLTTTEARVLASIVPDVESPEGPVAVVPGLEPSEERFRLFDSVRRLVEAMGADRPLVLVLDDLHAADRPSLELLAFLATAIRRQPILIVAAYRTSEVSDEHPLAQVIEELASQREFVRITLAPLERPDVEKFVTLISGATCPLDLADMLHARTEGNPFFMTEVVRLLDEDGRLAALLSGDGSSVPIDMPDKVRAAILGNLRAMSGQTLDLLSEGRWWEPPSRGPSCPGPGP